MTRKTTLSPAAARAALRRRRPGARGFTPLAEGEESQAFGFAQEGERFVLRIHPCSEDFEKDAFVQRRFAGPALPIPQIVEIGRFDAAHAFCISRRAPGRTLQDLSPAELPPVLAPVADVMAAIAACPLDGTEGFGRFDARGVGAHARWQDFLAEAARWDWAVVRDAGHRARIAGWIDAVRAAAPHCGNTRALVHGDFGSNNVLTDGQCITAVIDWSEALFGDPQYELANILFWRPWLDCMEQQARFFEAAPSLPRRDAARLRCYQLRIGLAQLHDSARRGEAGDFHWAFERCAQCAGAGPT